MVRHFPNPEIGNIDHHYAQLRRREDIDHIIADPGPDDYLQVFECTHHLPGDGRPPHNQAIRMVCALDPLRRTADERQGLKVGRHVRQGGLAISIITLAASLNDIHFMLLFGHGCSVLAENFDALKCLGEGHTSLLPNLGVVRSGIGLALSAWTLHLASLAVERIHLDGECVSGIEKGVWLLGTPEIDFPDLVRFQSFLQMLWIRQRVTGVWENRIQGHTATDRMVAVTDVTVVWIYRDYGLRAMGPNLPNQLLT